MGLRLEWQSAVCTFSWWNCRTTGSVYFLLRSFPDLLVAKRHLAWCLEKMWQCCLQNSMVWCSSGQRYPCEWKMFLVPIYHQLNRLEIMAATEWKLACKVVAIECLEGNTAEARLSQYHSRNPHGRDRDIRPFLCKVTIFRRQIEHLPYNRTNSF